MSTHLSSYQRELIVRLFKVGHSTSEIIAIMEQEGRRTTRETVRKCLLRWKSKCSLTDELHPGRPTKVTVNIFSSIEKKLEEDEETTSEELKTLIVRTFAVDISAPTIRRHRRKSLKWKVVRTRFGPMI